MRYFFIAGEASGDLHASNLMRELKIQDSKAEFCFLGGDLMQTQGGAMVKHYRQMAFMGIVAVLKNARTVLKNLSDCKKAIVDFQPDVLILVDYPGFNLRIARFVKKNLKTKVYYYISPKIWAWKEYRIRDIQKYIDKMFTIFPFETAFYAKHNYQVEYVGNPTVDSITNRPNQNQSFAEFTSKNNLSDQPVIAILAGSRKQEIAGCLPRMISATNQFKAYQPVISGAPGIEKEYYHFILKNENIPIIFGQTYELLQHAKAAVVNSGTATLETALIGTPQAVVYHVPGGRLGYLVKIIVVKLNFISLVNIIAGKEVVKELIAHLFTVEKVTKELDLILNNDAYRQKMISRYSELKKELGEGGAAKRAAEKMIQLLSD
jgi:lipid-A-disaccharide synthase